MKKEILSDKKGITLIALVVTIIVLLILAGVTIATLIGDNGILTRANNASKAQIEGQVNEEVKLAVQSAKMFSEEMATKTATGWLASENIGATSTQNYADMATVQKMTVIGQMRADLTKEKGYIEIANEGTTGGVSKIKVTYQTNEYKQVTNDSDAKIEITIKITGNTFTINEEKIIITFTIDGTEYEAEEGMKWEKWIDSSYNVDSYFIYDVTADNMVCKSAGSFVYYDGFIYANHPIKANCDYVLKHQAVEPM